MAGEPTYTAEGVAIPDSIDELHALLATVAENHPDLNAEDVSMMETAVIEIAGNLIEHGRPPGKVNYRLVLTVYSDRLEGVLSDSGEELPGGLGDPQMPDELAEDGRGLFLAHAVLDELVYRSTPEANTWLLVRARR